MKNLLIPVKSAFGVGALSGVCLMLAQLNAQDNTEPDEDIYLMSPFVVDVSEDSGYLATNAISGTRLNTAIRDLPMPLEVITEDFLRDTGSNDLRSALRFSSGIMLQSQNDFGAPGGDSSPSPGNVNNPEGLSGSPYQTSVKIRGFQTDSVLRDGFRRRNASDSVNISRIEVVRGPASLLYGVGNFGGVVNYLVKRPTGESHTEVSTAIGSDDFFRVTLDTTDRITDSGSLAYRATAALQEAGSFQDFNTSEQFFVSPVLVYRPTTKTEIVFDLEYGEQEREGISWRSLRSVASNFINWDGGEAGSFLQVPGRDPATFRWSGPDTYNDSTSSNVQLKVTQELIEGMYFMAGYNRSAFDFHQLDNMASLELASSRSGAPDWAIGEVNLTAISPNVDGVATGPNDTVIAYQWEFTDESNLNEQIRAELNYSIDLFDDSEGRLSWLRSTHDFLLGYIDSVDSNEFHISQTPGDVANFHNPTNPAYIRFGVQGDGITPDLPMRESKNQISDTDNSAYYAVYQGKYLDNRLNIVAGVRRDSNSNYKWRFFPNYRSDGSIGTDEEPSEIQSDTTKDTTTQWGVSYRVIDELSVYVMRSEGVQPNFEGYVDFSGVPVTAALATNEEFGVKIDLFDGKVSGTISFFEITRERSAVGAPSSVWFAPTDTGQGFFDPNSDIVYNINDFNPYNNSWNAAAVASTAEWDAAVASGAIYQATNSGGNTNWYVNASQAQGAALMDAVFANAFVTNSLGWFGWIYNQDNLTNNATLDYNGAAPPGPTGGQSVALGSDESKGWDMQVIFTPFEDLQIVASWAHIEKKVLSAGSWAQYPYPQDRWAVWYFPVTWAGLLGQTLEEAYADPTDTSTRRTIGTGLALDDTPENHGNMWVRYRLPDDGKFAGLTVGFGASYEGPRTYFSGITRGGGSVISDGSGDPLTLETDDRFELDAFIKYDFTLQGNDASVQLNVDNVLDEQKLYGLIYQAPRTWRAEFNYRF